MSAVDAAAPATRPRRLSTRFLRSELWLIFGRRRNWAGLAVLAALPIIMAISVYFSDSERSSGGEGPDFFSAITSNGLFVAFSALAIELGLFLPLAVATVSTDAIAGEANLGTLRYLLSVPVHRTRLLLVKYAAVVIFTVASVLLVAVVGVLIGLALFGGGSVTLLSGSQVPFGDGLLRLLAVCGYISACLCAVGAIGLFVSTLTEQPIGGAIAVMVFVIGSFILGEIPQLEWVHPYLLTENWLVFGDLLRDPVPWDAGLSDGLYSALAYALIFLTAAWARLSNRDVTS